MKKTMAIVDASLKQQIFNTEDRMADRVKEALSWFEVSENDENPTYKQVFDYLLILYENAIHNLKEDIIRPCDDHPARPPKVTTPKPSMMETTDIVKRLNKGYLRFVYDTSKERILQHFKEEEVKEDLNPSEQTTA